MADVAQSRVQHDVHPLLRHPRPIKRDSAKAQRMLGLITDSEEKSKELQREKSITTRWLERPMYRHLELSDVESEKDEPEHSRKHEPLREVAHQPSRKAIRKVSKEESDADLLDRWTNPDRSTSVNPETIHLVVESKTKLDTSFVKRRPQPLNCARPVSYNAQHLLSADWTASPSTMSPNTPAQRRASSYLNNPSPATSSISSTGSVESKSPLEHPQTWPAPCTQCRDGVVTERPVSFHHLSSTSLGSPQLLQRPRPTSFATYHQRNRSGGKIASSRGLRNNSYPNFSRPSALGAATKAVPGEHMENDMVYRRFGDDEVGPPSPTSPARAALNDFETDLDQEGEKDKTEKKSKNRWSTIPQALKKLAVRRRSSAAAQEPPAIETKIDDLCRMNLTEENLECYEKEITLAPSTPHSRLSGIDHLPTPNYSPLDDTHSQFEPEPTRKSNAKLGPLPLPFAPWAELPISPAASTDRRRSSGTTSLSPTRRPPPSRLSVDNLSQVRPLSMHSQRSSIAFPSPPCTAPQRLSTFGIPDSPRTTSRLGTPIPEPTCILCKTSKPHSEFVTRRITSSCWHEPATCLPCLQAWISHSVNTRGWDNCTCPECGDSMTHDDIDAFVEDTRYLR